MTQEFMRSAVLSITEQVSVEDALSTLVQRLTECHRAAGCHLSGAKPRFAVGPAKPDQGIYVLTLGSTARRIQLNQPQDISSEAIELGLFLTRVTERWIDALTQVSELQGSLDALATADGLTGLSHRRSFIDAVTARIREAESDGGRLMAMMVINIRDFRLINEQLGHDLGDELLFEVATRVRTQLREHDLVSRLERDRFAVLLDQIPSIDSVERVGSRLLTSLEASPIPLDLWHGCSVGIALFPRDASSAEGLVDAASTALVTARTMGQSMAYFESN
ncbi:MAG: diguanylate cyclase domain-containing protein [Burkholderiaceae bacterium]